MTCELDVTVYQKASELKEKSIGMQSLCIHLLHWSHCTHWAIMPSLSSSSNHPRQPRQILPSLDSRFFFPFPLAAICLRWLGFFATRTTYFVLAILSFSAFSCAVFSSAIARLRMDFSDVRLSGRMSWTLSGLSFLGWAFGMVVNSFKTAENFHWSWHVDRLNACTWWSRGVCSTSRVDMSTGTLNMGQGHETFSCHMLHVCQVLPTKQIPVWP